ncbi:MAG: SusC/RagA family TonB-linked outer membrane protein, partial [Bacteroidota bacterium]
AKPTGDVQQLMDAAQTIVDLRGTLSVVTGTLRNDVGDPLEGASVRVKGTKLGTLTKVDGSFSLEVPDGEQTIMVSYVGYISQEFKVDGDADLQIVMELAGDLMDEVVVVGYGVQQEREVISAISDIGAEVIERSPTTSFTQALQGTLSGVQMISASGEPNSSARILVRGVGSITTATEPLFILDGLPVASGGTNPLNYLSPNDIQSVTVLKDAAATSIYGSRGANGVVLITTKTGQAGQQQLNFSYDFGVTVPINAMELASADEWRDMVSQARATSGLTERFAKEQDLIDQRQRQRYVDLDLYNTVSTDWVDLMQQNGRFDQYTLSASNATEKASYYLSGQYRNQAGNFVGTNFERITGRVNLDFSPTNFLKLGVRYTFIHENNEPRERESSLNDFNDRIQNRGRRPVYGSLYGSALPIYPEVWPDDGSPFDPLSNANLTYLSRDDVSQRTVWNNRNVGSLFLELNPIKGLTLRGEAGGNYNANKDHNWTSARAEEFREEDAGSDDRFLLDYIYDEGVPRLINYREETWSYNLIGTANYTRTLASDHHVNALLGVEANYSSRNLMYVEVENAGAPQDPTEIDFNVRDADQLIEIRNFIAPETRFFSTFGRLNYNYREKYFLQGTLRRDGSSRFTPEDRFSWFPSASAGWIISDEPFLAGVTPLSFLKVRFGWGVTGNDNIGDFRF